MPDLVICVATDLEATGLPQGGRVAGRSIVVLRTGVGAVNAACTLTRYLARESCGAVVSCGVAGAYPETEVEIGTAVCAASECYADLGAETPDGFLDMEALGFRVVGEHFNHLPLDLFPAPVRLPFVTRETCSGRDATARAIAERTGGAVESMEGAAIVHTALLHTLPVGEVRGISNRAGNRDRGSWRLERAARAASTALLEWIEETAC